MNKLFINCFTLAVLTIYLIPFTNGQAESGLFSKLMMMMMKNRRRTYAVPFAIPFNPLSYSSIIPINYPATLPIGGYPNYRSASLISSLNGAPLGPFGGISPFSLGTFAPFLSSLRGDHKFLSRSSYEPTVASSSLIPQYTVVAAAPPTVNALANQTPAASTNSFLIASPTATITNPLTAINNLLPSTFNTATTNQSPSLNPLLTPVTSSNTFSNSNSLTNSNSLSSLTNPTLSNSHLYSSTNTGSLLTPISNTGNNNLLTNNNNQTNTNLFSNTGYSNQASNGNSLDKTMTGTQGELIKQELKEHHMNTLRIQYLKSLRDHLIKDNLQKEQYLKELTKKSMLLPYLEMYEEVGNNNNNSNKKK